MKRFKILPGRSSLKMNILYMLILVAIALYASLALYCGRVKNILSKNETGHINLMLDQIVEQVNTVSNEAQNIAIMLSSNDWSKKLLKEDHPSSLYQYYKSLSKMVFGIQTANSNISNIALISNDTKIFGFNRCYPRTVDYLAREYDFTHTLTSFTVHVPAPYEGAGTYAFIFPVIDTDPGSRFGNKLGSIIVYCNVASLKSALERMISEETQTSLFILDSNNSVVTSAGAFTDEANMNKIILALEENTSDSLKDSLTISKPLAPEGWRIVSITPMQEIEDSLIPLTELNFICIAIILLIIIFISFKTMGEIAYPIKKVVSFVEKREFTNSRLNLQAPSEIEQIAYYINLMLDQTDEITNELLANKEALYELEIAQKQAEIAALTSQINPHFLYNTLNCIAGYGYTLGNQDIADIATSLSSLLRYSIKGTEFVSISEEIKFVREYMNIMKIRFPGRYQITCHLDEELMDVKIPRLILQPFVENSIKHGCKNTAAQLTISLKSYINEEKEICFDIVDNGCGLSTQKLEKMNNEFHSPSFRSPAIAEHTDSIGMSNIVRRLKLLYGNAYGVRLQHNPEGGLIVHIHIPSKHL